MEKMILEHVNIDDIPVKWKKFLKDFISPRYKITIEAEQKQTTIASSKGRKSWKDMPMFGMWKDRADITSPVDYVNQIRKSRF